MAARGCFWPHPRALVSLCHAFLLWPVHSQPCCRLPVRRPVGCTEKGLVRSRWAQPSLLLSGMVSNKVRRRGESTAEGGAGQSRRGEQCWGRVEARGDGQAEARILGRGCRAQSWELSELSGYRTHSVTTRRASGELSHAGHCPGKRTWGQTGRICNVLVRRVEPQ